MKQPSTTPLPRILVVCLAFPPANGGIQRFLAGVCAGFPDPERVVVLAPQAPGAAEFDRKQRYSVIRYPATLAGYGRSPRHIKLLGDLLRLSRLCMRIVRQYRIDVVFAGEAGLQVLLPSCLAHFYAGIPWYLYAHGSDFLHVTSPSEKAVFTLLAHTARCIFVNSVYSRQRYQAYTHSPKPGVQVINPGIDDAMLDLNLKIDDTGARPSAKCLLTVSRLIDRKGHDMVIRALPQILSRFPDLRYVIVGEGPSRPRLERLADEVGVRAAVDFRGPVSDEDLVRAYKSCDVFIMPCREESAGNDIEGFGIVFLEAALCARPVIAGRSGGVADAVEDGVGGFLVNPNDPQAIAEAALKLLSDPALCARMGAMAQARVLSHYTYRKVAERLLQYINHRA